jgi:hypothetical protein
MPGACASRKGILLIFSLWAASLPAAAAHFTAHTIATDLKGGYQVVTADLNQDGRPDLIALASGMDELVWYENPGWQRHVIVRGMHGMINCAAFDIDGDGTPEIVLASGFGGPGGKPSEGNLILLHHDGDPRGLWTEREIDRLPMSHRLRWANLGGESGHVLIDAPLTAAGAQPPHFPGRVPITLYHPGSWLRQLVTDADPGLIHGLLVFDWNGDGRDELLTAGFDGIHLLRLGESGHWSRERLTADPSSDIAVGHLGTRRFLCAIQPWHGNTVAVYRRDQNEWRRQVIDDSLVDAHTILTADFDGNGRESIVAGFRGGKRSVYLYSAGDPSGEKWQRTILDDGDMSAAACAAADIDQDGRIDVVCIGTATQNLKWYRNTSE